MAALEVARLAALTGDTDKAQELYTRVANGGYGWTAGLALWDQANALIEKGDHEAARRLLQQPVTSDNASWTCKMQHMPLAKH